MDSCLSEGYKRSVKRKQAVVVEYTDCNSREGLETTYECPRYGTKQSDVGECGVSLHCNYFQVHSDSEECTW